jgi:nicotinamidase-related amidase
MIDSIKVLETLEAQIEPSHTALLIVDVQNDFVHPDGWVATQAMPGYLDSTGVSKAVSCCGRLLEGARAAGVLRVFIRMLGDEAYLSPPVIAQYRRLQGEGRPGCTLEGTWGAEVHDSLCPRSDDPLEQIVAKARYSAFAGTRLDQLLRSHGIKTLVLCGVATSGCVESTTRDAFCADYYVVTASDACADYDPERHDVSLRKIDLSFGYVVDCDRILESWGR